jgi:flagellar hook assembly protein FlgD
VVTAPSTGDPLPNKFVVHQNYPNPFNQTTFITFELPEASRVTVEIYNALGQRVNRLLEENQQAGSHRVQWRGQDDAGRPVSSGLYFYKVTAGDQTATGKMMLLQ